MFKTKTQPPGLELSVSHPPSSCSPSSPLSAVQIQYRGSGQSEPLDSSSCTGGKSPSQAGHMLPRPGTGCCLSPQQERSGAHRNDRHMTDLSATGRARAHRRSNACFPSAKPPLNGCSQPGRLHLVVLLWSDTRGQHRFKQWVKAREEKLAFFSSVECSCCFNFFYYIYFFLVKLIGLHFLYEGSYSNKHWLIKWLIVTMFVGTLAEHLALVNQQHTGVWVEHTGSLFFFFFFFYKKRNIFFVMRYFPL